MSDEPRDPGDPGDPAVVRPAPPAQHPDSPAEHPDSEVLSAYVDGSLEPAEHSVVRAHLVSCPPCRTTERELELMRQVLRTLPFVDAPTGFYERTLRQGPRPRSTANQRFGIAVTLAILMLVSVIVVVAIVRRQPQAVRPAVPEVLAAFAGAGSAGTGRTPVAPRGGLPSTLPGGYALAGVEQYEGREYLVYRNGDRIVKVTWADGSLAGLRGDVASTALTVDEDEARYVETPEAGLLFVERGDRVYIVELPPDEDPVAIGLAVPVHDAQPSVTDRVEAAGRSLLETFGFGG